MPLREVMWQPQSCAAVPVIDCGLLLFSSAVARRQPHLRCCGLIVTASVEINETAWATGWVLVHFHYTLSATQLSCARGTNGSALVRRTRRSRSSRAMCSRIAGSCAIPSWLGVLCAAAAWCLSAPASAPSRAGIAPAAPAPAQRRHARNAHMRHWNAPAHACRSRAPPAYLSTEARSGRQEHNPAHWRQAAQCSRNSWA
jgi:hypothetical protein